MGDTTSEQNMVLLYDPVAEESAVRDELAPRLLDLNQRVIGLLDNTKDMVETMLEEIQSMLQRDFPKATFRYFRKESVGGASEEVMRAVASCDAVVAAVGD